MNEMLIIVALFIAPAVFAVIAAFRSIVLAVKRFRQSIELISFRQDTPSSSIETTERIVMDPNAGYRGSVRVEPVPKEHLLLWSLFLVTVAVVLGVIVFR